jgi:hypothetical protein
MMSLSHSQFDIGRTAPLDSRSGIKLRIFSIVFAIVLCLQATWILVPELFRQPLPFFPAAKNEIDEFSDARTAAGNAARFAWVRGDLWVNYALAVGAPILDSSSDLAVGTIEENHGIAEHAATLAPYDARVWLLLSGLSFALGTKDNNAIAQLKMSFYTAPNDSRLIPLRLSLATRLVSIDEEVQNLIEHDVRTVALHRPELNSAMLFAYNRASSVGREFIEKRLAEIDPRFLTELRNSFK